MKDILVPFDFTDISQNALNFAHQLCNSIHNSTLTLYHVIEHPSPSSLKTMGVADYNADPAEALYIKKMIDLARDKMNAIAKSLEMKEGSAVNQKIKIGNPDKLILNEVKDEGVDVVIMGTSGSEGIDEFFVGSNAEKVVRHATCPVITLQRPADIQKIKKIVFASDFTNDDPNFIGKLLGLQEIFGAELKMVKINTPASFTSTRYDMEQMEKFVAMNNLKSCSLNIYNYANEEDGIIAFAEDMEADMIALGTYQFKGIGHFLRGSIAEDVVNHSTIPVWTYHLAK